MKAISLWQPWASLVAHGLKRVETRGWSTPYRGLLAIHAAMTWNRECREACVRLTSDHPEAMARLEPPVAKGPVSDPTVEGSQLPRGAIVAVARLVDVHAMTLDWIEQQTDLEYDVGGWEVGRYGWVLEDVRRLPEPIAVKGRQGLFDLGGELAARVDAAATVRP